MSSTETALFSPSVPLNAQPSPTPSPTLFLNLPISSLEASTTFYTALGFVPNRHFADPTCIMMSLPPLFPDSPLPQTKPDNRIGTINVMLLTRERFAGFLPKREEDRREVVDAKRVAQGLFCLSCETREEVDGWVKRAVEAGGKGDVCELQIMEMEVGDDGKRKGEGEGEGEGEKGEKKEVLMYGRSFEDLDGHIWEVMWMDTRFTAGPPPSSG